MPFYTVLGLSLVSLLLQDSESFSTQSIWTQRASTRYHHLRLLSALSIKASEANSTLSNNAKDEEEQHHNKKPKGRYQIVQNGGPKNVKKRQFKHSRDGGQQQFRQYLRNMNRHIRSRRTLANRLDDEVKKMEVDYYGESVTRGDQRLKRRYPNSIRYDGPIVAPDVSCYAIVANAYAKAGLGRIGAELAESVYERCSTYSGSSPQSPNNNNNKPPNNMILKTAVANAWIQADEWDKADEWMANMEHQYQQSGLERDAPDTIAYTHYLEGLAVSKCLRVDEIVRRCDETLQKMTQQYDSGENPHVNPNRFTYIAAMKCRSRRIIENCGGGDGIEMVQEVEDLLREMETRYERLHDPDLKPTNFCYVPVANAAARCKGGIKAAELAEALLLEQQHKYSQTGDPDNLPLDGAFTACFTAYARVEPEHLKEASLRVRQLFAQWETTSSSEREKEHNRLNQRPSVHTYTSAINGIVIDATPENLEEATRILQQCMPQIDSIAYQCVIRAYAKSGNAAKAEELLWELQEHAAAPAPATKDPSVGRKGRARVPPPDAVTVAACINAWVSRSNGNNIKDIDKSLDHAAGLLELIITSNANNRENNKRSAKHIVEPWVFENVIRLWSISKRKDAGEQAERLVEVMQEIRRDTLSSSTTQHLQFEIPFNVYTLALDAWATSGHKDAADHAIKLLGKMQELSKQGEIEELNNRALSTALVSITKSMSPQAMESSFNILEQIIDNYTRKGDRSAVINARTYTMVLNSLARRNENDAVAKSISLLQKVRDLREQGFQNFEPNTIAYNCLLNLLARRGLAERAEEVLEEMNELAANGDNCEPNTVSYSCVCRAYANCNNNNNNNNLLRQGANRTLEILAEVEEKYYGEGNQHQHLKPDTFLINACLTVLARTALWDPGAATKANELLSRMELSSVSDNPIHPDLVSYSNVCQAYAASSHPNGAERAEEILQRAENLAADGLLPHPPDRIFFSSLVQAFTRNKVPNLDKAQTIIHRMEELAATERRRNITPTTQIYNFLLSGWAHSRASDKLKRAKALLDKMKERSSSQNAKNGPDVASYNWVILAAAHSTPSNKSLEKAKASFQVALDLFREVHEDDTNATIHPNSFTYSYFLKACNALLPAGEDREKLTTKAFTLCQQRGLVSKEVWADAIALIPEYLERAVELEGMNRTTLTDGFELPEAWTRNLQCTHKENVRL